MSLDISGEVRRLLGTFSGEELRQNSLLTSMARDLMVLLHGPAADDEVLFTQATGGVT